MLALKNLNRSSTHNVRGKCDICHFMLCIFLMFLQSVHIRLEVNSTVILATSKFTLINCCVEWKMYSPSTHPSTSRSSSPSTHPTGFAAYIIYRIWTHQGSTLCGLISNSNLKLPTLLWRHMRIWVRFGVSPRGICTGQSGTGTGHLGVIRFWAVLYSLVQHMGKWAM
jgi:hypothetical protein